MTGSTKSCAANGSREISRSIGCSCTYIIALIFRPAKWTSAEDGVNLRYRFASECDIPYDKIDAEFHGVPCSMLEMMVALAVRIEEHIMEDSSAGNRVGQWFWNMIVSLGLAAMDDGRFHEDRADYILDRFERRDYEYNGAGGLFTVNHPTEDMRRLDIWYQLMHYLQENEF